MSELHWKTAITKIEPNKIFLRGYPLHELMGKITFSQAIYLALKGELPSEKTGKLIDAILVSSIDHGATPPSVLAARTVASTGADLNSSVSAGILAISKYHGGAIEEAMAVFEEAVRRKEESKLLEDEVVIEIIKEKKEKGERISGFGHRIHTKDPRTQKLFSLAEELGFSGRYVSIAKAFEKGLEKILGKSLPINVDGAIAALLCELGIPKELGNSFFIMARVPGLIAHIYEEKTRMKPMRKIHPIDHEYDGPEERKL
jgi:citrate synthase